MATETIKTTITADGSQFEAVFKKAEATVQRYSTSMNRVGVATKNSAGGFLAFSQAVEDAQYGIRGVLNNIPSMVMGFGGGMGLAGALSLAAVAASALYPHLKKLTGSALTDEIEKGAKAFKESWEKSMETVKQLKFEKNLMEDIAAETQRRKNAMREALTIQSHMISFLQTQNNLQRESRTLTDELAAANNRLNQARGGDSRTAEKAAQMTELKRLQDDASANSKLIAYANQETARLIQEKEAMQKAADAELSALNNSLESESRKAMMTEARLAEVQARIGESGIEKDPGLMQKIIAWPGDAKPTVGIFEKENLRTRSILQKEAEATKNTIATLEAKKKMLEEVTSTSMNQARQELEKLYAIHRARTEENAKIQTTIAHRKKLFEIGDQVAAAEAWKTWQTAVTSSTQKANEDMRNGIDAAGKFNAAAEAAAREESSRAAAKAQIASEIAALQFTMRGRKDIANALTSEIALRREAAQLAEQTGWSEEKALKILREKAALEKGNNVGGIGGGRAGADGGSEPKRHRGLLGARFDSISSGFNARHARLGGLLSERLDFGGTLRSHTIQKRTSERRGGVSHVQDVGAAKFWEQQLNLQEKLVKHIEKLGIV